MGIVRFFLNIFARKQVEPLKVQSRKGSYKKSNPSEASLANMLFVQVRLVHDGDTVDVLTPSGDLRLRLSSIDCPEGDQPWGDTAKAGLIKLIGGREVLIETHGLDVFGRTIATVYVRHGSFMINVNERMVMRGHAWVARKYYDHLPLHRRRSLNQIERWAQNKRVGLWRTENPVPPWQWRKQDSA